MATSGSLPPMTVGRSAASSLCEHRCCLMAQSQNSLNRICPPSFLRNDSRRQNQTPRPPNPSRHGARDRQRTHVSISRKQASASVICTPHSACEAAACHQKSPPRLPGFRDPNLAQQRCGQDFSVTRCDGGNRAVSQDSSHNPVSDNLLMAIFINSTGRIFSKRSNAGQH